MYQKRAKKVCRKAGTRVWVAQRNNKVPTRYLESAEHYHDANRNPHNIQHYLIP